MSRKFADNMNEFLEKNAFWICLAIVVLILIATLILIFNGKKQNKKNIPTNQIEEWVKALGDIDNIQDVNGAGSRLSVVLSNKDLINRDELTRLGASSIVVMSNKMTIVIEDKAEKIASDLKQFLSK